MATTSRLAIPYPAGTDLDDVPNWMNQMAVKLDAIIAPFSHGALASRPVSTVGTPGIADRFYYATDVDPDTVTDRANVNGQLYRDNGTGWDPVGPFASKMAIGSFNPPAVTGTFDVTGLGFQPKLVKFTMTYTDQSDTAFAFGEGAASSSTNRRVMYIRGSSGSELRRRWYTNRCIVDLDISGTIVESADLVSMLADGFRLNFTVVPSTSSNHIVAWEAWG